MAEREGDEDRLLHARLEKLSGALQKHRKESLPRRDAKDGGDSSGKFGSAMGLGMRVASEFAAAIVVGGLIGWLLDYELGTKPAFMIVFFLLGVAAGVWNVIRATSPSRSGPVKVSQKTPPAAGREAPPGADEDED
jgi:ATP synthase protein I